MGSYAECWLSKFYVGSTKNDIDPAIMQLFCASDKKIIISNKANLPNQLSRWVEYSEEEDDINVVFYSCPARIIKARLELVGYSFTNAKKAYSRYLDGKISRYEELAESGGNFLSLLSKF
jgi:HEPN/Toprim N-terminal domain 1